MCDKRLVDHVSDGLSQVNNGSDIQKKGTQVSLCRLSREAQQLYVYLWGGGVSAGREHDGSISS